MTNRIQAQKTLHQWNKRHPENPRELEYYLARQAKRKDVIQSPRCPHCDGILERMPNHDCQSSITFI